MKQSNHLPSSYGDLLASGSITAQTRAVLQKRLDHITISRPFFFNEAQFETLRAVCDRLIPQEESGRVDLAGLLDEQLSRGDGKGWRYDELPQDAETFRLGIDGIAQSAHNLFEVPFHAATSEQQDLTLHAIQSGNIPGEVWRSLPPQRFFEELLAAVTQLYYSHPIAKQLISDVSFADAHGWHNLGLDKQLHNDSR